MCKTADLVAVSSANGEYERLESVSIATYSTNVKYKVQIYKGAEDFEYFDGQCDLNQAIENIKQHTRNYAKRQLTYFARFKNAKWIV